MDDFTGITAAAQILDRLNIFSVVAGGIQPGPGEPVTPGRPAAWIYPTAWKISEDWNDPYTESRLRTVFFEIMILTEARDSDLTSTPQELASAVEAALHGTQLDNSWAQMTRCETGRYTRLGRGINRVHELTVTGEFSYEV